jgi:hypothetical protein
MQLTLRDGLLLVPIIVGYRGREIEVPDVVVDTGSATTLLSADMVAPVGIVPELDDVLHVVRGVGGAEVVFARRLQNFMVGERSVEGFEVEVGAIDVGFDINGILGMDFLLAVGAIINLRTLELHFSGE